MDPTRNPYTPGAGKTPVALVGRGPELDQGRIVIARTSRGMSADAPILYGLRGVGKTVLLKALVRQAEQANWLVVEIEGKQEESEQALTRQRLARGLITTARSAQPWHGRMSDAWKRALRTIASFTLGAGVTGIQIAADIDPARGRGDSGDAALDLEELVHDLVPALRESNIGLGVFVDEIQDLDPATLSALLSVQHRAHQNDWPFQLYGAGLPDVPARLAEIRSYAERFAYVRLGPFDADDARAAFVEPARSMGVEFEDAALDRLVMASGGYPYFVQVFGDQAWRTAPGPRITASDAQAAVAAGTQLLDEGLFRSRWNRATPVQREFMRAMAQDHGPSQIAVLVTRLGKKKPSSLSVAREALITKGLVFAPDRGQLQFTVPHMDDYIRRQHEG
jgi:hypothetical protein